jgi:hypothetical protein
MLAKGEKNGYPNDHWQILFYVTITYNTTYLTAINFVLLISGIFDLERKIYLLS